jgi:hypothetical protein
MRRFLFVGTAHFRNRLRQFGFGKGNLVEDLGELKARNSRVGCREKRFDHSRCVWAWPRC